MLDIDESGAKLLYASAIKNAYIQAKNNDILAAFWLMSDEIKEVCGWIGFEFDSICKTVSEIVYGGDYGS